MLLTCRAAPESQHWEASAAQGLHVQRLGPAGQHVALGTHAHRVAARLRQLGPAAPPQSVADPIFVPTRLSVPAD